jgi:hypothetical protein
MVLPMVFRLSPLSPVPLEERGDAAVVGVAVQFVQQLIRAEVVVIAPPSACCVVPDAVAARYTPRDVPPPLTMPPNALRPSGDFAGRPQR